MESSKIKIKKLKEEERRLRKEIKEKTISYILAAFGLVAGLAWNEAIKSLIEELFPVKGSGVFAKFIYAFLITVVVVIISVYLVRLVRREEREG